MRVNENKKTSNQAQESINIPTKKHTIHNVFILDCSGSMYPDKYKVALDDINKELKELSNDTNVTYINSVIEFGSRNNIIPTKWMIKDFNPLMYRTSLGQTALKDAVLSTLLSLETLTDIEDRVLVKIFTDGGENDSIQYKSADVKKLITANKSNFTITFIGTREDTGKAIREYGLSANNTLIHNNTVESIAKTTEERISATKAFSRMVLEEDITTTDSFYSKGIKE